MSSRVNCYSSQCKLIENFNLPINFNKSIDCLKVVLIDSTTSVYHLPLICRLRHHRFRSSPLIVKINDLGAFWSDLGLPDFLQQNTRDFCLSVTFVKDNICVSYYTMRWLEVYNYLHSTTLCNNKNLAIANRSRVSCAYNSLRACPWPWNLR